jgi:precorrin-3B synthase
MMAVPLPPTIKGWCPSVLKPMQTGDGLLVRLHLQGNEISSAQFAALGELAQSCGNGLVDLTRRGHLQLRGVRDETLPRLIAALQELALLGSGREQISDVILSPLAGLDATASINGRALAQALETALLRQAEFQSLPDKFCFSIDEGGRLGLDNIPADIRLIGVEGHVLIAVDDGKAMIPLAITEEASSTAAATALAGAFLSLRENTPAKRMVDLVRLLGAEAIAQRAGFEPISSLPARPVRVTRIEDVIGVHQGFLGIAAPFGRLSREQMTRIAEVASQGLHVTPWRSLLLPGVGAEVCTALERAGLMISVADPRLAIVACPGRPACASAQIDTRHVAEKFAPFLYAYAPDTVALHISGCSKSCAHGAAAPLVIVGRDSTYDLVLNGRPDDEPYMRGLDLSHAIEALQAASAERTWS